MKKNVTRKVQLVFCNICEKEIINSIWNKSRIDIVKTLFKTEDFDTHEVCINKVIREAFAKYF